MLDGDDRRDDRSRGSSFQIPFGSFEQWPPKVEPRLFVRHHADFLPLFLAYVADIGQT